MGRGTPSAPDGSCMSASWKQGRDARKARGEAYARVRSSGAGSRVEHEGLLRTEERRRGRENGRTRGGAPKRERVRRTTGSGGVLVSGEHSRAAGQRERERDVVREQFCIGLLCKRAFMSCSASPGMLNGLGFECVRWKRRSRKMPVRNACTTLRKRNGTAYLYVCILEPDLHASNPHRYAAAYTSYWKYACFELIQPQHHSFGL